MLCSKGKNVFAVEKIYTELTVSIKPYIFTLTVHCLLKCFIIHLLCNLLFIHLFIYYWPIHVSIHLDDQLNPHVVTRRIHSNSFIALYVKYSKIRVFLIVYSRIRTELWILPSYRNIRIRENPCYSIFDAAAILHLIK